MNDRNNVVINTMVMYIKMILSLFVTFYSTRIILDTLGVTDFGIYNLVAGTISLMGFLNGSMSNTSQRFFAFELGRANIERLKSSVKISLIVHFFSALIISVILLLIGPYLFDYVFNIIETRIESAKTAYNIMIFITFINILSTTLTASIYAHEDIYINALIEFIASLLKLFIAIYLIYCEGDKLIFYSLLLLLLELLVLIIKYVICNYKYIEYSNIYSYPYNKKLASEIFPFLGINIVESISWLTKGQVVAIMMNTVYGTIVNASYGVANQINGQILFFSRTLINAIVPQIHKTGGKGDKDKLIYLSIVTSKFSFFMLLVIFNPFLYVIDYVFNLWLIEPPLYASGMCVILIICALVQFMCSGINIAVQAKGLIKEYQLVTSLFIFLSIPLGYLIYLSSDDVYFFLYYLVFVELCILFIKYKIGSKVLNTKFRFLFYKIFIPCTLCALISIPVSLILYMIVDPRNILSINILYILIDIILILFIIYFVGLSNSEKQIFKSVITKLLTKLNII